MKTITNFLSNHLFVISGILIGGVAGFLYYYYIGCVSGTCAITSKPLNSTLYGALMGGLFFQTFKQPTKKNDSTQNSQNNLQSLK